MSWQCLWAAVDCNCTHGVAAARSVNGRTYSSWVHRVPWLTCSGPFAVCNTADTLFAGGVDRGNSRRPRSRQLPRSWRRKRPSVQRSKLPRTMPLLPLLLQPLLLHQPRAHPPVLPPAVQEAPLVHRLLPPVLQPLPILRGMTSSMRPSRSKRKWCVLGCLATRGVAVPSWSWEVAVST